MSRQLAEERIPQREIVLKYLQDNGVITPVEAINELGITRLAAVICDLRKRGYAIDSEEVQIKNKISGKIMPLARYAYKTNSAKKSVPEKAAIKVKTKR